MNDREQNIGTLSTIGRGMAVVGLFLSSCGPSAAELDKEPKLSTTSTILKTNNYRIERLSPHVLKVVGEGKFMWEFFPAKNAAVQYLRNKCKVEYVLGDSDPDLLYGRETIVVVTNDDCVPEVK